MKKFLKISIICVGISIEGYTETTSIDKLVNKINEELVEEKKQKKLSKNREKRLQEELEAIKKNLNKIINENKELKKRIKEMKNKKRKRKKIQTQSKKTTIEKKINSRLPIHKENSNIDMDDTITVTVAKGESLKILAKRYYGDETKYHHILNVNKKKIPNHNKLELGISLIIPGLKGE